MSGRQTQSYLRNLFASRGIALRHRLGQNFLIDLNLHELLVREAAVESRDVILEVGCGAGALTSLLSERAGAVVAVEVDPRLVALACETLLGKANVRVIETDALEGKHALSAVLVDQLQAGLAVSADRTLKLVANLPYAIATPIITNLLVHPTLRPKVIAVTIQKELAERMAAEPLSPNYSALSVLVRSLARVEILRTLPPAVFWPRPKVDSAIIRITPDPVLRERIMDLSWFHTAIRLLFQHRRKNLRGAIHAAWGTQLGKPEIDALLDTLGLEIQVRPEALDSEEYIELASALRTRLTDGARADLSR
jgi:16S rRNA (adenine1518-N6/adenine1519-N6)-dimethyltransferase